MANIPNYRWLRTSNNRNAEVSARSYATPEDAMGDAKVWMMDNPEDYFWVIQVNARIRLYPAMAAEAIPEILREESDG